MVRALNKRQRNLADRFPDLMRYVGDGAQRAITECQRQFKKRRWNCSAHNPENVFGNILKTGTKYLIDRVKDSFRTLCAKQRILLDHLLVGST